MTSDSPLFGILKLGDYPGRSPSRHGDYEHWFGEMMGLSSAEVLVTDPRRGDPFPDPRRLDGIVVTGSAAMVSAHPDWSVASGTFLAEAHARGLPILGVCYGHQLLAEALDGKVGPNPKGREIGTVRVELLPAAEADPLFAGLPSPLEAQATHSESVLEPPPGAVILARNELDECQAMRLGPKTWTVQFHPELKGAEIAKVARDRAGDLRAEGLDPDAIAAAARDTPNAEVLLSRFARIVRA